MRMNVTNAETAKETTKEKLVVENVVILDASGSMRAYTHGQPTKYQSAIKGINDEINTLKSDPNATHLYTLVEFSDYLGTYTHFIMSGVEHISEVKGKGADGGTPLYATMTKLLTQLLEDVKAGRRSHQVLVKIFTDGQDTDRWTVTKINGLVKLIRECEDAGITITFIATEYDKEYIRNTLTLKDENMYAYDNTARGATMAMDNMTGSTMRYTKSYASGASVETRGNNFFTRTDEDAEKGK